MNLFVFRRACNPDAEYREQPEDEVRWPLTYAIHPTRANITAEEWATMIERLGKKDNVYFAEFVAICRRVDDQLEREGVKPSDVHWPARETQLMNEMGAVPGPVYRALQEVLEEEGFTVLEPQEFTYQLPLRDYDKEKNARMAASDKRDRRLN